jgi:hypothetical protein
MTDLERKQQLLEQKQQELTEAQEPTIAPGMNMNDQLEEPASAADIEQGDSTPVVRLYVDRTPEE